VALKRARDLHIQFVADDAMPTLIDKVRITKWQVLSCHWPAVLYAVTALTSVSAVISATSTSVAARIGPSSPPRFASAPAVPERGAIRAETRVGSSGCPERPFVMNTSSTSRRCQN
jgi:hypothetical protein